jgi:circadian clock protein KaiC
MQAETPQIAAIPRVQTGISGLDTILNGGLLKGGSYLLLGASGTGKTVLTNQMAFYHARDGGRVVYITLLAESHSRMLGHMQTFEFFTPEPIARSLYYLSALAELEKSGLGGVLDVIRQTLMNNHATLLILDGLETAHLTAESEFAFRRFVKDFQVTADATGCTALFISDDYIPTAHPEQMLMDGVIKLHHRQARMRTIREIEITKFRGSPYLEGRHVFTITQAGIVTYPRREALVTQHIGYAPETRTHVKLDIPVLDDMLNGGLLSASSTMVYGPSGSGKTMLGLHFLAAGAKAGEPCLHFGFYEPPPRTIGKADKIGLNFSGYVEQGLLQLIWHPPVGRLLDALADQLIDTVEKHNIKRLFLDGLDGFRETSFYPERVPIFFTALMNELRVRNVTTVFTVQADDMIGPTVALPIAGTSAIAENILFLRYVEWKTRLYRLISIIKVRESIYDHDIREFKITPHGVEIAATFESAEDILSGLARTDRSVSARDIRKQKPGATT